MRRSRVIKIVIGLALVGYLAISMYATRDKWLPWIPGVATKLKPAPDPIIDGRPLQEWVKDLSDPNPEVRRLAAETLGNNGKHFPRAEKVAPALGKLLQDPDATVRAASVAAFGKVHLWAQGELTTLLEIAEGDNEELRTGALEALIPFIDSEERIEQFFRAAVKDKGPEFRGLIFDILVKAAPRSAAASAVITDSLRSEDEDIRLLALMACCVIRPDPHGNLGTICEILGNGNVNLRRKAAEAASRVCASTTGLAEEDKRQKAMAAVVKPDIEPPDGLELDKPWLDELPDAGKIKAALVAGLRDSDSQVRCYVAKTIISLGVAVKDAKPVLTDLLNDPTPEVRANAASALGSFGTDARDTEGRMLALLSDPNSNVRNCIVAALRKIGADPRVLVKPLLAAVESPEKQARQDAATGLGEILATADKLGDDGYKEIFFALMRRAQQDEDELFKKDPSEFILPVNGIALEHMWRVHPKVVQIILPPLVEKLKDSSGQSRDMCKRAFADLLNEISYSGRVRYQKDAFLDSPAGRQARAAVKAVVPLLTPDLKSPDGSVRDSAARALASIGPEAKEAVLELGERLKLKDKREYLNDNFSLRQFGQDAAPAVPVLIELIHSSDLEFQVPALISLEMIGPVAKDAVPALLGVIRDPRTDDELALHAASALFRIAPAVAAGMLEEKINDAARRQLEQAFARARRFDPKP